MHLHIHLHHAYSYRPDCPCTDEPGRPVSRYQQWARSVTLPREGGYRWHPHRLYGHHRRKSDSKRESWGRP